MNQLEKSVEFNPTVHEQTEQGDPQRNEDGSIRLKRNWKDVATDRQGRTYNPHVHGDTLELDSGGFLKVRRRDHTRPIGDVSRTEAFVAKYRENGYAYYVMNDEGGRMEQFLANDWEPVQAEDAPATIKVGQARAPGTRAFLMRKPQEWYDADQQAKIDKNKQRFAETTSPKEEDAQYRAAERSPLR